MPLQTSPSVARLANPELAAGEAGFKCIAGIDEAGRGPWAGPVVAAAVVVDAGRLSERIDDSKRLTLRQRERAYRDIIENGRVGVGMVSAEEIDRINILQATLKAMSLAFRNLDAHPDVLLVDGNRSFRVPIPVWTVEGGDHLSLRIACASIVAKVMRDRCMRHFDTLYPGYGFGTHKGYGTSLHAKALEALGPCPIHRLSFRPVSRVHQSRKGASHALV